jgi:hypothetical protein
LEFSRRKHIAQYATHVRIAERTNWRAVVLDIKDVEGFSAEGERELFAEPEILEE